MDICIGHARIYRFLFVGPGFIPIIANYVFFLKSINKGWGTQCGLYKCNYLKLLVDENKMDILRIIAWMKSSIFL